MHTTGTTLDRVFAHLDAELTAMNEQDLRERARLYAAIDDTGTGLDLDDLDGVEIGTVRELLAAAMRQEVENMSARALLLLAAKIEFAEQAWRLRN